MKKIFIGFLVVGLVLVLAVKKENKVIKKTFLDQTPAFFNQSLLASSSCEFVGQEMLGEKINQELSASPPLAGQSSVSLFPLISF